MLENCHFLPVAESLNLGNIFSKYCRSKKFKIFTWSQSHKSHEIINFHKKLELKPLEIFQFKNWHITILAFWIFWRNDSPALPCSTIKLLCLVRSNTVPAGFSDLGFSDLNSLHWASVTGLKVAKPNGATRWALKAIFAPAHSTWYGNLEGRYFTAQGPKFEVAKYKDAV